MRCSRSGKPLREVQQELDSGNPHVAGFALPGSTVDPEDGGRPGAEDRAQRRSPTCRRPRRTSPADKPWVVIGAHYDHLGRGDRGTSLAGRDEAGGIHHGADDNASGTAAVLAIADALAKFAQPRRRNVLIALWSAEEIGLVGSNAFVTAPPVPLNQIAAYLNFDMVGRMQDNKLIVQATGTSPVWARLLERANVAAGFDLVVQPDPYQPTDVASFNQAGVVTLTSRPARTPTTTSRRTPPTRSTTRTSIASSRMAASLDPVARRRRGRRRSSPRSISRHSRGGTVAGFRVTTGTIPDYATEVKGLLLGGVIGGGPAEQAGLMKGDIIVEIAGQSIANIYDYTYALELLKVNQPVKVVYIAERRAPRNDAHAGGAPVADPDASATCRRSTSLGSDRPLLLLDRAYRRLVRQRIRLDSTGPCMRA